MATVFRKNGSPFWYAAYFDCDGKRHYRSTKKRKKTDAIPAAAEYERAARQLGSQDTEKGRRVYAILEEAAEQAVRNTLTEASARHLLDRILEASSGEKLQNPSIEEWLLSWLDEQRLSKSYGTFQRYSVVVKPFLEFLSKERRAAPLGALSVTDVRRYRDLLLSEGRSIVTANMAVKILRTPLNAAKRQGIIIHNPADAVEILKTTSPEKGIFSSEQVNALLKATDGDWEGMILGGFYTGARLQDLANLSWKSIDLEDGVLEFDQGKTGKGITIPLHPIFRKWLKARKDSDSDGERVFPTLASKRPGGKTGLSVRFSEIMDRAGISGEITKKRGKMGRNRSSLSFHSLRHSFNTAMANAGISQELRQKLTGHASKAVNDRYTHTDLELLRGAVESVPSIYDE